MACQEMNSRPSTRDIGERETKTVMGSGKDWVNSCRDKSSGRDDLMGIIHEVLLWQELEY